MINITYNRFTENTAAFEGAAVMLGQLSSNTNIICNIDENIFSKNILTPGTESGPGAIFMEFEGSGSTANITNNIVDGGNIPSFGSCSIVLLLTNGNSTIKGNTVSNNVYTGSTVGSRLGAGIALILDNSICNVSENKITGNKLEVSTGEARGGGILLDTLISGACTINNNEITGNSVINTGTGDACGGGIFINNEHISGTININRNNIYGNTAADGGEQLYNASSVTADGTDNWWNSSSGPGGTDVFGPVTTSPFATQAFSIP